MKHFGEVIPKHEKDGSVRVGAAGCIVGMIADSEATHLRLLLTASEARAIAAMLEAAAQRVELPADEGV